MESRAGTKEKEIRNQFYVFGEIRSIRMAPKQSCAFVTFVKREVAEQAAKNTHKILKINGKSVHVTWGRPQVNKEKEAAAAMASGSAAPAQDTYKPYYPSMDPSAQGNAPLQGERPDERSIPKWRVAVVVYKQVHSASNACSGECSRNSKSKAWCQRTGKKGRHCYIVVSELLLCEFWDKFLQCTGLSGVEVWLGASLENSFSQEMRQMHGVQPTRMVWSPKICCFYFQTSMSGKSRSCLEVLEGVWVDLRCSGLVMPSQHLGPSDVLVTVWQARKRVSDTSLPESSRVAWCTTQVMKMMMKTMKKMLMIMTMMRVQEVTRFKLISQQLCWGHLLSQGPWLEQGCWESQPRHRVEAFNWLEICRWF